jgi:glucose/arabinose dehydrogenase
MKMVPYESGPKSFLVVDQSGVIYHLGAKGGEPGPVFLDVRDRMVDLKKNYDERGLLGMAFHPRFAENGKVYVYYSAPLQKGGAKKYDHTSHLSEFRMKADKSALDPATERVVMKIDQPQWNHNSGLIEFGPDGFLYIALGDGGAANDKAHGHEEEGNGQAMNRLLGKILRIDVNNGDPYSIPADNPFVGKAGRDEIFAVGFRNPWGMSFDTDGRLFVADVGQNRYEEVAIVSKGENHGWPLYEGLEPFSADKAGAPPQPDRKPMPSELTAPILTYPHSEAYGKAPGYGISITGGHVYRGKAIKGLEGAYVFGDYPMSWATSKLGLYAGVRDASGEWTMHVFPGQKHPEGKDQRIVGFGLDAEGEHYVLTNTTSAPASGGGAIWKIVPAE